jgi:hypothetical protein
MDREIRFIAKMNLRNILNNCGDAAEDPLLCKVTALLEQMECNDYYEAKARMGDTANSMSGLH